MTARHWLWFDPDGSRIVLGLMDQQGLQYDTIREAKDRPLWIRHGAQIQQEGWKDVRSIDLRSLGLIRKFLDELNEGAREQKLDMNFRIEERVYVEKPGGLPRRQVAIVGG